MFALHYRGGEHDFQSEVSWFASISLPPLLEFSFRAMLPLLSRGGRSKSGVPAVVAYNAIAAQLLLRAISQC